MKNFNRILLSSALVLLALVSLAQPPGGGRRGGGPEEMIKREKQAVYTKITDLSDDQKMLLDGIYEEFGTTLRETFEEMRNGANSGSREGMREKMREKMTALRKEKDELVKDVLNEGQYKIYEEVTTSRRGRRQNQDPNGDGQ